MKRAVWWSLLVMTACNPDPGEVDQQVDYRDDVHGGPSTGERGNIIISEVLWSGSMQPSDDGWTWDPTDVFVEVRNQGAQPVNLSGWRLILTGPLEKTFRVPASDLILGVGEHAFAAAKTTGCFPEPDWVIPELTFPTGDGFQLTLRDVDEHLIEPIGSRDMPPFAGGYDLVTSRSMERIELMFGQAGSSPQMWHFYTDNDDLDVPNDDRVKPECRPRTLASPGRPNSPDYSGAYASGGFE